MAPRNDHGIITCSRMEKLAHSGAALNWIDCPNIRLLSLSRIEKVYVNEVRINRSRLKRGTNELDRFTDPIPLKTCLASSSFTSFAHKNGFLWGAILKIRTELKNRQIILPEMSWVMQYWQNLFNRFSNQ